MKFNQAVTVFFAFAVVACAPKATIVPTQSGEKMVMSGGVAVTESLPPPAATKPQTPIATPALEPVIVAQNADVIIGKQEVTTSDVGISIRFSVGVKEGEEFPKDGARIAVDTAKLGLVVGERPTLYRIRDDQFGQAELVENAQQAVRTAQELFTDILVPAVGNYLIRNREKIFVEGNIVLPPILGEESYGVFPMQSDGTLGSKFTGPAQAGLVLKLGSYTVVGEPPWTRDETFPVKVNVFIHPISGHEHRSLSYSMSEWVRYDANSSPRKDELAKTIRGYFLDRWNTRLNPDIGASAFNANRRAYFDPGTPWEHLCGSAGCNETTSIWAGEGFDRYNDLGQIEDAPARGGSQHEVPDLVYATISKQQLPWLMSLAYLVNQRDAGLLNSTTPTRAVVDALVGKPTTLLNDNGRALAWDGRGTGFPVNMTYPWFAVGDEFFPFFQKRITEAAKYRVTPCGSIPTNLKYMDLRTGECFYNYAEGLDFLEDHYASESVGMRDVIVGYVPAVDPEMVRKAESAVLSVQTLRYMLQLPTDIQFQEKFERDALPLGCFLIAKSPSLTPNDPLPNENILSDCAVGVAQQLNLKNGRPILSTGSTYKNFGIDMSAINERLPVSTRKFKTLPLDHLAITKGNPLVWDIQDQWLLERTQKLREEENNLVITDDDKWILRGKFIPAGEKDWLYSAYNPETRVRDSRTVYYFYPGVFTYTQDPLSTKQKNRVQVKSSGFTVIGTEWWDGNRGGYYENYGGGATSENWSINRDFIKRNGRWHLVRLASE